MTRVQEYRSTFFDMSTRVQEYFLSFYKEQFSCYLVQVCSLVLLSKIVLLYSCLNPVLLYSCLIMFFCTPV